MATLKETELVDQALALPASSRARLAQRLWESVGDSDDFDDADGLADAIQRDEEMSSGKVAGIPHEEVMKAARDALR